MSAWSVRSSGSEAVDVSAAGDVPYRTPESAASSVRHRSRTLVVPGRSATTSETVGPTASTRAVAVAVCAGAASAYETVTRSPSRTWSTPSTDTGPRLVGSEALQTPPPIAEREMSSPESSNVEFTRTWTEAAPASSTSIRIASTAPYTGRSTATRPYPPSRSPTATRANGCGPTGTFAPITRTVHAPTAGVLRITASSTFTVSKAPPAIDCPSANVPNTFPRYTVPSGAVTSRFRSLTRAREAARVPG